MLNSAIEQNNLCGSIKNTMYLHRAPNAPFDENTLKLAEIKVFERPVKYGTSPDYKRKKQATEPEMIVNVKLAI